MKKAVLIVHGFVGTLFDNEYLMNYLELNDDFDVFAKTLPGHHFNYNYQKVEFTEWLNFIDKEVLNLIDLGYKKIYLIGHSMGGVLISYVASKYEEIKKIVFLNAAFNYLNFKQNKIDILTNKNYKDYVEIFDLVFHTSIPFFLEFVKLVKSQQETLKNVYQKALIVQSDKDQVVPIENGNEIYNKLGSRNKYLTFVSGGRHHLFEGNQNELDRKKEISEYIRLFLRGGYKWKKIYKEKI